MRRILEPRRVFEGHAVNHEHHVAAPVGEHKTIDETHETAKTTHKQVVSADSSLTESAQNTSHSIAFIDTSVSDWQVLAQSLSPNTEIVKIAPGSDALAQMTQVISQENNIETISIISYGQQGSLSIGSGIDASTLSKASVSVSSWSDHMAKDGQILLWGCDAGAGTTGTDLVDTLHTLTKADVAASLNPTGDAAEGGDWTLESKSGDFAVHDVFATQVASLYDAVLDKPVPSVTFQSGQTNTVLVGDTFSETVDFKNTASAGVGYSPYVAFVVPKGAGNSVSLATIKYLDTDLTSQAVTEPVGADGKVLNPYNFDANGQATSAAVSGANVGDQVVFVKLPFGSYSPGQPAAAVTATFTVDKTAQVGADTIAVSAFGGFALGADAQDDPATDASITSSTVANTVVSTSLVSVQTTAATVNGEGETATGADFPVTYNTVITPASATANDALSNFTTTITLPPDVILSGDTTPAGEKVFTQAELDAAQASGVLSLASNGIDTTGATFTPGEAPGTITVTFPTLQNPSTALADGSRPDVTVAVKTYIGQTGADGNTILSSSSLSKQITAPTVTYSADPWGADSSASKVVIQNEDGDTSQAQITAKALALQTTAVDPTLNKDGGVLPGDSIDYTTKLQLSDYGSATADSNFVVTQTLTDGQTITPSSEPVFTDSKGDKVELGTITNATSTTINPDPVTGQGDTVYTSGSNDYWSFTRDDTGKTVVTFNIGKAMQDGVLPAGTTGSLSFQAQALSAYTPQSGNSTLHVITEQDTVGSSVTGALTLKTLNDTTPETDTQLSDTSSTTLTVPTGKASIDIVAVNGQPVTSKEQPDGTTKLVDANGNVVLIQPNDSVTYASTYSLQSGDYNDLTLTSYLPQDTFSTSNPTEAADGSTFQAESASDSSAFPASGQYKLVSAPDGVTITGNPSTDSTSNSLGFKFSQETVPSKEEKSTTVTVQFTVTASNAALANGLPLTALVQGDLINGSGYTISSQKVVGTTLAEPSLSTTTGIVSVVSDTVDGKQKVKDVAYSKETTDPSTIFNAAGTTGDAFLDDTTSNATILGANDLNVSASGKQQVDGGDTVRIATTVENTGSYAAYDVQLAGELPTGVTSTDSISNFQVYKRDSAGNLVGIYDAKDGSAAQAAIDYFSTSGLALSGDTTSSPVLYGTNDTTHANQNTLFVVYDVTLPQTIPLGQTLTGNGSVLKFSNVSGGTNFVTQNTDASGVITSLTDAAGDTLTDKATIDLANPDIQIATGASDNPDDDHNTTATLHDETVVTGGDIVLGETRPITLSINTPEGTLTGANGGDVTVTVTLPTGMDMASDPKLSITLPDGTQVSDPSYTVKDGKITFDLGKTVTNPNADTSTPVSISFDTIFPDTTNVNTNQQYKVSAALNYSGGEADSGQLTFTQINPVLGQKIDGSSDLQATLTPDATTDLHSGQVITYTYSVKNTGAATAEDIAQILQLDPTLKLKPGSFSSTVQGSDGSVISLASDTTNAAGDTLSLSGEHLSLKAGEAVTFTFQAVVQDNQIAGTKDNITAITGTYNTMPAGSSGTSTGHQFTFGASASSELNTFQNASLSIVGEANGELSKQPTESNPLNSVSTPVGDILRLQGSTEIPEGQTDNVVLTVNIPDGMTIPALTNNTVTIAFVNPQGALLSSTLDKDGTNTALQQTVGSAGAGIPTYTLDSSQVQISADGKTLSINLGTISNNDKVAEKNKVVFEFNALVDNTQSNTNGKFTYTPDSHGNDEYLTSGTATQRTATLSVDYTGSDTKTHDIVSDADASVTQTIVEPHITLTKDEVGFDASTNTATYTVTVTNNGDATVHQLVVTDPLTSNTTLVHDSLKVSGPGIFQGSSDAQNGVSGTILSLAVGQSETFTYQVQLADITQGPPVTKTTVTYEGLSSTTPETLSGTKAGALGSAEGGRTGDALTDATAAEDHYYAQATSLYSIVTGTLYNALGNVDPNTPAYDSKLDNVLPGVEVTATYVDPQTGQKVTTAPVKTDANGLFRFSGIPNADVTISVLNSADNTAPLSGESNVVAYHGGTGQTDGSASVTIKALDGTASADTQFVYRKADTAPTISGSGVTTSTTPTDVVTIKPNQVTSLLHDTTDVKVADQELDALHTAYPDTYSYGGTVLTIQRYNDAGTTAQPDAHDIFGAQTAADGQSGGLVFSGSTLTYNGKQVGTVTNTGGVLSITLAEGTTGTDVQNILSNLTYENTNTSQDQKNTKIGITLDDSNVTNPDVASPNEQGTGSDMTSAPVFTYFTSLVNTAPETTYNEPNDTAQHDNTTTELQSKAQALGFPEITGQGNIASYVVTLGVPAGTQYPDGTDPLSADRLQVGSTDIGNIQWNYNQGTHTLTLTSEGGTATTAEWNNAITTIGYYNTSDKPITGERTLDRAVTIEGQAPQIDKDFSSITVQANDDSPILAPNQRDADGTKPYAPVDVPEDQATSAEQLGANSGTLVSQFINSSTVTDPDANNLDNSAAASTGALPGMAVTATADSTLGTWYYTTNGGTTPQDWHAMSIQNGQALYLVADANTKICFVPTQLNYNGTILDALTYRAWDQADPHDNGSTGTLPTGQLGSGTGPEASYSAQADTLDQVVRNINNAPDVKTGQTVVNAAQDEDTSEAKTVEALFNPDNTVFDDSADQQKSDQNPKGSVADSFAGVAITNNAVPTSEGAWQYSTDSGATWHDVGQVSESSALVLSNTTQMRFVPADNFNGTPQALSAHLIDSSATNLPVSGASPATTGQELYNSGIALTGVDATQNGGSTALSEKTVQLSLAVTPVNDAPTATGSAVLQPAKPGDPPASATVNTLFGDSKYYNDTADQQQGASNRPDGESVAQGLGGVAITANTTPPAEGSWRYSTDGGVSWHDVGQVSENSALVLSRDASLQFNPAAGFTGTPDPLGVHLIDGSNTALATTDGTTVTGQDLLNGTTLAVTGVDASQNGGTTALSKDSINLNTHLAPTVKSDVTPGQLDGTEDATQPVKSVTALFGNTFSDTTSSFAGVAITSNPNADDPALQKAEGTWRYSTDGGASWHDVGQVSESSALVLSGDALLQFDAAPNFNGAPPPLKAHLVDNSDLPVSGTITGADIAKGGQALTGVDVTSNGGATPLSTDEVTLAATVAAVPDAPTAQGPVALPAITQDDPPQGDSVADLFGTKAGYSNATDNTQLDGKNPTGTTDKPISGVAITGNPTPSYEGSWVYSTDSGKTWVAVPQDVSSTNALVLPKDVLVGFKPAHDFNGAPLPLEGRPIAGGPGMLVPGMQGADVTSVMSNVDISHADETGAVALHDVPATVTVNPLLLRPEVTAGSSTVDVSGNGGTVSDLFGNRYDDHRRAQQSDINPTGSKAEPFGGIAITSNPTTPAEGVWRYSTDGGKTWNTIPNDLTPGHAFVVPATAQINFKGSGGYTGSTTLTAHLVREVTNIASYIDIGTGPYGNSSLGALQLKASTVSLPRQSTTTLREGFSADAMAQPTVDSWVGPYLHPYDHSAHTGWLKGYDTDAFVMVNTQDAVSVNGLFKSSDPASVLSLKATQRDDAPLPNWVTFDAMTGTFTVVPPSDAPDSLDLKVEARDNALRTAQSTVHIVIGRDPMQDLLGTLPTLPDLAAKPVPRAQEGHKPFHYQVHQAVHHA